MTRLAVACCTAGLALAACIPSVHPIYTDADLITDDRLLGVWENPEEREVAVISDGPDGSYRIAWTESGGQTGLYRAYLARIDSWLVLDITAEPTGMELVDDGLYLPLHVFMVLDTIGEAITLSALDHDSASARLPTVWTTVDGESRRDPVLIAETPTLQAALGASGLWRRAATWRRVTP